MEHPWEQPKTQTSWASPAQHIFEQKKPSAGHSSVTAQWSFPVFTSAWQALHTSAMCWREKVPTNLPFYFWKGPDRAISCYLCPTLLGKTLFTVSRTLEENKTTKIQRQNSFQHHRGPGFSRDAMKLQAVTAISVELRWSSCLPHSPTHRGGNMELTHSSFPLHIPPSLVQIGEFLLTPQKLDWFVFFKSNY